MWNPKKTQKQQTNEYHRNEADAQIENKLVVTSEGREAGRGSIGVAD